MKFREFIICRLENRSAPKRNDLGTFGVELAGFGTGCSLYVPLSAMGFQKCSREKRSAVVAAVSIRPRVDCSGTSR